MLQATRLAFAPAVCVALCVAGAPARSCPRQGQDNATVARVETRLELRLTDGRLLRLAGFDPALSTPNDPELQDTAQARLASMLGGKAITLTALSDKPDRWGRIPAYVFSTGEQGQSGEVAAQAIGAGLGRYLAEPAAHACRDVLMSAERRARSAALGLWQDPYYAVLTVDDHASFAERSATVVVAEGQLTSVEPSPYRTTLRFAAPGLHDHAGSRLVATIAPHVMKTFERQQVNVRALIGRRIRVRGLLDLRFGPRIALDGPDAIETDADPGIASLPAGPN